MKIETEELKQKVNEFIDGLKKTDDEEILYIPKGYILVHWNRKQSSVSYGRKDSAFLVALDKIVSVVPTEDNECFIEIVNSGRYFIKESMKEVIDMIVADKK